MADPVEPFAGPNQDVQERGAVAVDGPAVDGVLLVGAR